MHYYYHLKLLIARIFWSERTKQSKSNFIQSEEDIM